MSERMRFAEIAELLAAERDMRCATRKAFHPDKPESALERALNAGYHLFFAASWIGDDKVRAWFAESMKRARSS